MDLTFEFRLGSPINGVANKKLFTGRVVDLDSQAGIVEIEDETGLLNENVRLQDIEFLAALRGTVCCHYPDRENSFALVRGVFEILERSDKDELHKVVESRVVEQRRLDHHDEGVTLSQPSPFPEVSARSSSYSQKEFWALVCQIAMAANVDQK